MRNIFDRPTRPRRTRTRFIRTIGFRRRRRWTQPFVCGVFRLERAGAGRLGEIFLTNHKAGSAADTAARDSAIVCSLALQFGADVETIRKALCRDPRGRASGPLGAALDRIIEGA